MGKERGWGQTGHNILCPYPTKQTKYLTEKFPILKGLPKMIDLSQYEIWFVTGSQHLYGPEAIEQVGQHSQEIAAALNASPAIPTKVVYKPVVTTPEDIYETLQAANADPKCVGVVTWMHTFSPAKMWIAGLSGAVDPIMASVDMADVTTADIAARQPSNNPARAQAVENCVPLISARPSFAPRTTGVSPAFSSASPPGIFRPS